MDLAAGTRADRDAPARARPATDCRREGVIMLTVLVEVYGLK
jgi:hypothetical protein